MPIFTLSSLSPATIPHPMERRADARTRTACDVLVFCLFWSAVTGISLLVDALLWQKPLDRRYMLFVSLSALSAFIAAAIAAAMERCFLRKKPAAARFAAMIALLSTGTMALSFLASALYTMQYFLPAMAPFLSAQGFDDLFYFFLAHGYSFAVLTARLFLPLGFTGLVLAGIFYCIMRHAPPTRHISLRGKDRMGRYKADIGGKD